MALKKCTSDGAIKVSIDIIIFIFEIAPQKFAKFNAKMTYLDYAFFELSVLFANMRVPLTL